jgi:magnesium-transporting ATPase (P-type)
MDQQTGKYIIIAGIIIIITGIIIYFFHGYFKYFGRLPGDIRFERNNFRFYFPIVTMIVISIILTLLINIFRRL